MLARQSIQRKARGDLRYANRAVVDHHVLDGDQQTENDRSDHIVSANHEISERFDHMAGRVGPLIAVQQNQAGGRNIERQPEKSQQQERGRKHVEFDRTPDIHRDHHYDDGHHDIDDQQKIEHVPRERRD